MPKRSREPVRTCVGCRQAGGRRGLVRLVRDGRGIVVADPTGRAPGRGAYLHPDRACADLARKRRSLERALGGGVDPEVWGIILSSGR